MSHEPTLVDEYKAERDEFENEAITLRKRVAELTEALRPKSTNYTAGLIATPQTDAQSWIMDELSGFPLGNPPPGCWEAVNAEFARTLEAERDALKALNAELVEALKRFANLDNNVPSGTWAVDASYCERARAALAKVAK